MISVTQGIDETLILEYYDKLSRQVILDQIHDSVAKVVVRESEKIGKKLAKIYEKDIEKTVRNAVRAELGALKK